MTRAAGNQSCGYLLFCFSCHNEMPVFPPVFFNIADKLVVVIFKGKTLDFVYREHIHCPGIPDTHDLLKTDNGFKP